MPLRIVKIDADKPSLETLKEAANHLRKGRVIVCPTDTGYAFAANAIDKEAVVKVFNLKGRSYSNPMHIALDSMKTAQKYAHINKITEKVAEKFLPGALTMVLHKKKSIPDLLVAGKNTVGIRIPDNKIILSLCTMTGLPLTATSANISGEPTPYSAQEVVGRIGADANVALVLDQGSLPARELSTIIDLTVYPPQLLRQGKISWLDLRQFIYSI